MEDRDLGSSVVGRIEDGMDKDSSDRREQNWIKRSFTVQRGGGSIFKTEMTIQRGQRHEQRGSIVTQMIKDSSEMGPGMSEGL